MAVSKAGVTTTMSECSGDVVASRGRNGTYRSDLDCLLLRRYT